MCLQNSLILKAMYVFKLIRIASWSRDKCPYSCNLLSGETIASCSFYLSFKEKKNKGKRLTGNIGKRVIVGFNLLCSLIHIVQKPPKTKGKPSMCKGE